MNLLGAVGKTHDAEGGVEDVCESTVILASSDRCLGGGTQIMSSRGSTASVDESICESTKD